MGILSELSSFPNRIARLKIYFETHKSFSPWVAELLLNKIQAFFSLLFRLLNFSWLNFMFGCLTVLAGVKQSRLPGAKQPTQNTGINLNIASMSKKPKITASWHWCIVTSRALVEWSQQGRLGTRVCSVAASVCLFQELHELLVSCFQLHWYCSNRPECFYTALWRVIHILHNHFWGSW